jgi:hypothetical protein
VSKEPKKKIKTKRSIITSQISSIGSMNKKKSILKKK